MYLFNSPVKPLVAAHSSINTSPRRCRLSSDKVRAFASDGMSLWRQQEQTFVVSSLSEPIFCPSITTPFTFQATLLSTQPGDARNVNTTVAIGSGARDDEDELMTFEPHAVTATTTNAAGQDCLSSTSDRNHYGFSSPDGLADLQHMSLLTTQLRTQRAHHAATAQHAANHRNRADWAQIIDGNLCSELGVPRVTWSRTDEAALMRQFMEEFNLTGTPESSPPRNFLNYGYWPVDSEQRFYDVVNFIYTWAEVTEDSWIVDVAESFLKLDAERDVYANDTTDMQGINWSEETIVTRDSLIRSRQHFYPKPACNYRNAPVEDERMYSFKSFHARHRAQCAHYQLRNLVTATSRGEVFYAAGTKVKGASLAAPSLCTTVMNLDKPGSAALPFRVTALASSMTDSASNVLIAGGFNGEYAVLNLDSEEPLEEGMVSHAYDGLVTHIDSSLHRRTGGLQAAFSTNDCHIRVKDIVTMETTATFQYNHAINATQLSADGRLRVVVGDHHDSLVVDAETGAPLVHLAGHAKDCFSCAWSQDGRTVATAAQDGYTTLWDPRMWSEPVDIVRRTTTCARSLHFTSDNRLVMAEDDDIVTIYDVKNRDRQDIVMFGSIAGVALLHGGEEIVVANIDATLGGLLVLGRERGAGNRASQLVI